MLIGMTGMLMRWSSRRMRILPRPPLATLRDPPNAGGRAGGSTSTPRMSVWCGEDGVVSQVVRQAGAGGTPASGDAPKTAMSSSPPYSRVTLAPRSRDAQSMFMAAASVGCAEEGRPSQPQRDENRAGDRVVVVSFTSCGQCWYCRQGLWSLCDNGNPNPESPRRCEARRSAAATATPTLWAAWAGRHTRSSGCRTRIKVCSRSPMGCRKSGRCSLRTLRPPGGPGHTRLGCNRVTSSRSGGLSTAMRSCAWAAMKVPTDGLPAGAAAAADR
jgi:hypothetical protein